MDLASHRVRLALHVRPAPLLAHITTAALLGGVQKFLCPLVPGLLRQPRRAVYALLRSLSRQYRTRQAPMIPSQPRSVTNRVHRQSAPARHHHQTPLQHLQRPKNQRATVRALMTLPYRRTLALALAPLRAPCLNSQRATLSPYSVRLRHTFTVNVPVAVNAHSWTLHARLLLRVGNGGQLSVHQLGKLAFTNTRKLCDAGITTEVTHLRSVVRNQLCCKYLHE